MVFRCLMIALLLVGIQACDPRECLDPRNKCEWLLKNSTGDSIIVWKNFDFPDYEIVHNDSTVVVYGAGVASYDETPDMFHWILDAIVIEDSLKIFSQNDVMLKIWLQSQRNDPGRQFFNEKYWQKREWGEGRYMYHEWTFELLPEDIRP